MTSDASLKDLLKPIPGNNPCGDYLHYDETYDLIRDARVEENENLPRGVWQRELKEANWKKVEEISKEALQSKTKDLQIAGWLMEAWLQREGVKGFHRGIHLVTQLVEIFWDKIYPELGEDVEFRLSPFLWMNDKLSNRLLTLELANPNDSKTPQIYYYDWVKLQKKPSEALTSKIEDAILDTDKSSFESLKKESEEILKAVLALETSLTAKLKEADGALYKLKGVFDDLIRFADYALNLHPKEERQEETAEPPLTEEEVPPMVDQPQQPKPTLAPRSQIESRDQAYQLLEQIATFLEKREPHSPTPYLIRRAVSWGDKSLADLISEFSGDPSGLNQLTRLLGLDKSQTQAQQPQQQTQPQTPPSSTPNG